MTSPVWHKLDISAVITQQGTRLEGLTEKEAANRLAHSGRNEIIRRKPINPWRLLLKQFVNYFIFVLLFAAILAFVVSYLPGESGRRLTAYFILGIIVLSVALNFFEEFRAQKELEALDRLLVFKTTVLRAGASRQIDTAEVVPGDILVLTHGQKVPADARLIEAHSLRTDESALTGESVGVDKSPGPVAPEAALAERTSMVYASTYITHGTGQAVAVPPEWPPKSGKLPEPWAKWPNAPPPSRSKCKRWPAR